MAQGKDNKRILNRARLRIEEGQREEALFLLESIQPDNETERSEKAYLSGWCYMKMRHWDDALRILAPIPQLVEAEADGEGRVHRTKLVYCLLRLGNAAVNLARWDDAVQHYTRCIKVLHDKNLQMPGEQVKARYGLATTQVMRGMYADALQCYNDAIKYSFSSDDDEERGNIYYGLAYLHRKMGDLISARLAAVEALKYFERVESEYSQHMMGETHNLLGKISFMLSDYGEASDYYTKALAAAPASGRKMSIVNCTSLAAVCLAQKRFEDADYYCKLALGYLQEAKEKDDLLYGQAYFMFGKVAQAKAEEAENGCKEKFLEEAIAYFEQAQQRLIQTQAYTEMAELYGLWGDTLERLGKAEDAIHCWKSGYEALAAASGPSWN